MRIDDLFVNKSIFPVAFFHQICSVFKTSIMSKLLKNNDFNFVILTFFDHFCYTLMYVLMAFTSLAWMFSPGFLVLAKN